MNKEILLTAGCSWTDKDFYSTDYTITDEKRGGWPMWPEIIANGFNLKSINLGLCGTDNLSIFESISKKVNENDRIKYVVIAWTSWDRFTYKGKQKFPIGSFYISHDKDAMKTRKIYQAQEEFEDFFFSMTLKSVKTYSAEVVNNNMRYMFLLSELLKSKNIPYLFFQALSPFPLFLLNDIEGLKFKYEDKDYLKSLISSPHHKFINSNKNIIGYPFMKVFNGYNLNHILNDDEYISELDKHPNRQGQIKISNHIIGILHDRNINI